jgi:hypothetical protein
LPINIKLVGNNLEKKSQTNFEFHLECDLAEEFEFKNFKKILNLLHDVIDWTFETSITDTLRKEVFNK